MSDSAAAWQSLTDHMSEIMRLAQIQGLLAWDQQVNLPPGAHGDRGAQSAAVVGIMQRRATNPKVGAWLKSLEAASLDPLQAAGVRNHRKDYERTIKEPPDLAARRATARAEGYAAWSKARAEGDFEIFAPALQTSLDLAREWASAVAPSDHPYDALLDAYDPGVDLPTLRDTFGRLRSGLVTLIDAVSDRAPNPTISEAFDVEGQKAVHDKVVAAMGYSMQTGRIDAAVHPFTVSMGGNDVRITTKLDANDLLGGLGATMHETGHALYELGIPRVPLGSGIDGAASLGVHESQSRFWENYIGRSRPFFGWFAAQLQEQFGHGPDADALYAAANRIACTPIRIYADEVTYNLHIIVRWQLEVALLEGTLAVKDLPAAWNKAYNDVLGLDIEDDLQGVLQDVHWGTGTIGYFPSYTLGNLYAASLGKTMEADLPDMWDGVGAGEFSPILEWLRDRVHRHGHMQDGAKLIAHTVGDVDLVENLLDYLWSRHGTLHGVSR